MNSWSSEYVKLIGGTYIMQKISIRELLEQERDSQENLIAELKINGQINIHLDDLIEFVQGCLTYDIIVKVMSIIDEEVCIYSA